MGRKRYEYEYVKAEIEKRGNILASETYEGSSTPLNIICGTCGEIWRPTFSNVLRGTRCFNCHGSKKHTIEEVDVEITRRGGTLLTKVYINTDTKLDILCNKCNTIFHTPFKDILGGRWCQKCAGNIKYTIEFIRGEIEKRDGTLLSTEYIGSLSPLDILCNKCNKPFRLPYSKIQSGRWCHHCTGRKILTYERAKEEVETRGGTLLSTEYVNTATKLHVRCNACGNPWWIAMCNILRGHWCPVCAFGKTQKMLIDIVRHVLLVEVLSNFTGFIWLRTRKGGILRLDIYVPGLRLVIEYDGQQHFYPVRFDGISKEEAIERFKLTRRRDALKNRRVKAHPEDVKYFIRIPYTEAITEENVRRILKENGVPMP